MKNDCFSFYHLQGFFSVGQGGRTPPLTSISPPPLKFSTKRGFLIFWHVKWHVFRVKYRLIFAFHPMEKFTFYLSPPGKPCRSNVYICRSRMPSSSNSRTRTRRGLFVFQHGQHSRRPASIGPSYGPYSENSSSENTSKIVTLLFALAATIEFVSVIS